MGRVAFLACACALVTAPAATASIEVARSAQRPALRVDARGWAEVSWTAIGRRRTILVPPAGKLVPGGRLRGPDVSRPSRAASIPYRRVLRQTPDGRLWALQTWAVGDGPVQLRFSRWRGSPTVLQAELTGMTPLHRLLGRAAFAGEPVTGTSPTPAGKQVRHYAWVDCFACAGAKSWHRLTGLLPSEPDGTFSLLIRRHWLARRYRVSVTGPNRGATLAPDASAIVLRPTIER